MFHFGRVVLRVECGFLKKINTCFFFLVVQQSIRQKLFYKLILWKAFVAWCVGWKLVESDCFIPVLLRMQFRQFWDTIRGYVIFYNDVVTPITWSTYQLLKILCVIWSLEQFYTYNVLSSSKVVQALVPLQLLRNAGIGVVSSVVSDTFVNVFRVIKTTKQSLGSKQNASYLETIRIIVAADGYKGLFGRGLRTRIYANALQSLVFTIVWRGLTDLWRRRTATTNDDATRI